MKQKIKIFIKTIDCKLTLYFKIHLIGGKIMKIKEIEQQLKISRANIRFYEKEGLLHPKRNENEYREYSEKDVKRLKQIIIFRKLNISLEDIKCIFDESKSLKEVSDEKIKRIEEEIAMLNDAKKICEMIQKNDVDISEFNEDEYLSLIEKEEGKGNMFYNLMKDYFMLKNNNEYQDFLEKYDDYLNSENGKLKKRIRFMSEIMQGIVTFVVFVILDYFFSENINYLSASVCAVVIPLLDVLFDKFFKNEKKRKYDKDTYAFWKD